MTDAQPLTDIVTLHRQVPSPALVSHGWAVQSEAVLRCWTPIVGPTGVLLLRQLDYALGAAPKVEVECARLAEAIGVGHKNGHHSPFMRSLARLSIYHLIRPETSAPSHLWVPRAVPPPALRHYRERSPGLVALIESFSATAFVVLDDVTDDVPTET